MPDTTKIVITGGPGSGKTVFLERLKQLPELSDFVFLEELARKILSEQPDLRERWGDFHREIYRRQLEREASIGDRPFITDRGTIDAFAFHPETMNDVGTNLEREYGRYSHVIQLGSAAALGDEFYTRDDIRGESVSEALAIEAALRKVWSGHPAYRFIAASQELEEKYGRFVRLVVNNIEHGTAK